MKVLQMVFVVFVAAMLILPTAVAGTQESVLEVDGMTCGSCVDRIQAALKKVDGVQDARVDLSLNEAFVTHDPSQVSREELVQAINALGYKASEKSAETTAAKETAAEITGSASASKS